MSENKNKFAHVFSCIPNIGSRTLQALEEHFSDLESAWSSSDSAMQNVQTVSQKKKEEIVAKRKSIDAEKEWSRFLESETDLFTPNDPLYPSLLREIPDPPYTLYSRGNHDWSKNTPMIAIVGSRKFTKYGEQAAYQLAEDLSRAGIVVVSGLAFGIDSIAHKGALQAGGETIAIMGNGTADTSLYPATHIPLAHKIERQGALVSEYHPDTKAATWTFPLRNRIVAGLTLGTIVIEAAEESGSLITARLALEYNREVFAVPGSIFSPASVGTNALLKRGAKMVCGAQDILEEFGDRTITRISSETASGDSPSNLSSEEEKILLSLSNEPLHIDKIIKITKLQTAHASSLLAVLEIRGLAKDIGGMHYIKL